MLDAPSAVVIGIGELGAVFAHGLLKLGHPVFPVTRRLEVITVLESAARVELVLLCVGEADMHSMLQQIPPRFQDRIGFVQNELVPRDWQRPGIERASGVVVWFEKKSNRPIHIVAPSATYGPRRRLLHDVLRALAIPAYELADEDLLFQLVLKNLYILVHNLAGIRYPGSVAALWQDHGQFALAVADDVLTHQRALTESELDRTRLLEHLQAAVRSDPNHACAGRTAPLRLRRVLSQAAELGLSLPTLEQIERQR